MIETALRRCATLSNVRLMKSSGRDLHEFSADSIDTVLAVDTFPYINQSGSALVATCFSEAARVLKPGGDFVILNYSYAQDELESVTDVKRLAGENEFDVIMAGTRPFALWDGLAFHLRKGKG
jgi:ubiquinone/menaquinone biosynthesis C-methylase UbiE